MKIIISAGGTGGHIYPALAILDEFIKNEKKVDVIYVGTHNRMEKDIITNRGIKYHELKIYGFSKSDMVRNFKNVFYIFKSVKSCEKLIDEFKPDIVIGCGGYVVYPIIKAAKNKKVPVFIHEQNAIPGKSNKALSKNANLVGISFLSSKNYFNDAKEVFYSGNPCASNAMNTDVIKREEFGFKKDKKFIVIVSGSLGSVTLNKTFKNFLKAINKDYQVLYITGKSHYDEFIKDESFNKNIVIKPYIDNLAGVIKGSDLIISRAGASTISEILALEIPSILIPSPYVANNHQYYNALDLKNKGVSKMIEEKNLTTDILLNTVNEILNDKAYKDIKDKFKSIEKIDSSKVIYDKIKEIIK